MEKKINLADIPAKQANIEAMIENESTQKIDKNNKLKQPDSEIKAKEIGGP